MLDFLNAFSEQIIIPALNAVTLAAIGFGIAWLKRKAHGAKMDNVQGHLDSIGNIAYLVVSSLNQTIVDGLKKDGGWDKDRAQEIKNRAITSVLRQIQPSVRKLIEQTGIDLTNYVANAIESAVREDKKS